MGLILNASTINAGSGGSAGGAGSIEAVMATVDVPAFVDADGPKITIPSTLNGTNLVRVSARTIVAGTTNATTIQVRRTRGVTTVDMLSTVASIASGTTGPAVGVIDAANDDVLTDDLLTITVPSLSTTAPKGLVVVIEFG
jgi:hypothetical protein